MNAKVERVNTPLRYTCEGQKYTFVYFSTGRITIQANNVDKFRCVFLDKHSNILGITLREISKNNSDPLNDETMKTPGSLTPNRKIYNTTTPSSLSHNREIIREKETVITNMEK